MARSTWRIWKRCGAIGLSCATGALMLITASSSDSSTTTLEATFSCRPYERFDHPCRSWLFHAGRMGEARSHLDRLAAQPYRLAGQTRTDSMGVWRNRAHDFAGRDCPHPGEFGGARKTGARRAEKSGRGFEARAIVSFCDESRLDTGFRADFCSACEAAAP